MCQLQYFCITPQHKTFFLNTSPCQATAIGYIWEVRFKQETQGFQLGSCMNDCCVCWTKCISHLSIAFIHTSVWYGKITQDPETTQERKGKMVIWYKNNFRILLISKVSNNQLYPYTKQFHFTYTKYGQQGWRIQPSSSGVCIILKYTHTLPKLLYGNYQVNGNLLGRKIKKEKKKEICSSKEVWKKEKTFGSEIL